MSVRPSINLKMLLDGRSPRRISFTRDVEAYGGSTALITRLFNQKTGKTDVAEYFDYDFFIFTLIVKFGCENPQKPNKQIESGTKFDEWGIGHWTVGVKRTYESYLPLENSMRKYYGICTGSSFRPII